MSQRPRTLATAVLLAATLTVGGCGNGRNAAAQDGTFQFVSPGGKTSLFYDPPASRGTIGDLSGADLFTGKPIHVGDFAGKVVVINVWGSWCAPCRTETPGLQTVHAATASQGVQFLGIDIRDNQQSAQDFVTDSKVTYPSIYDPDMRSLVSLGGNYPASVVPTTMVLDRRHRVAAVFLKALLPEDLEPLLARLTAEA